ncbi:MAG TPA: cytochrome c3 family protein [Gemmatimonadota bacterium]|nr:cytochrome c3 family protein [Gemmatimonadota bacterium]
MGLFPTCDGCHAGILSGDSATWVSVGPEFCGACHDGETVHKIEWTPPEHPRTNLKFKHTEHAAGLEKLGAPPNECTACHQAEGTTQRMQVVMARPALCGKCHGFEPPHQSSLQAACSTCHVPLAGASALTSADVASFPKPTWHDSADFILEHGAAASASDASCSVCHARQSCTRCHMNASKVDPIQALAPDPRVAALESGRSGEWPKPPNHRSGNWLMTHGRTARTSLSTCANCHAASACATCHRGPKADFLSRMPRRTEGGPTGVQLFGSPPAHGPGFILEHGSAAAAGGVTCSACHTSAQCMACHRGGVPTTPALRAPGRGGSGGGVDGDGPTSLLPGEAEHVARPAPAAARRLGAGPGPRAVVMFASLRTGGASRRASAPRPRDESWFPGGSTKPDTTPGSADSTARAADSAGSSGGTSSGAAGMGADLPPRTGGFHPPDYVLNHGADAFSRKVQCSECHSTQAFCLTCHQKMGVGREGPAGTQAFHDAEPDWLIMHGRAARQNMESCVACHQQSSCLRCHSAKGGFRIDPHGAGFDPDRLGDRSTISCGICHFSIPSGDGGG